MNKLTDKEVMQFMHNHVKETIGGAAKPFGFKFKKGIGAYVLTRLTASSKIRDKIIIGNDGLNYAGMPTSVDKTYFEVQELIMPVVSKRYPKYLEQRESEHTVYLFHLFNNLPSYKEKYYRTEEGLKHDRDEEIPDLIDLVKEYVVEVIIPELDKLNDLHYLHNWLMSIIDVNNGVEYWGCLQSFNQDQFHGFKHMAISKLIGGLDYEKVCAKMEEYLSYITHKEDAESKNLKPMYEELREYLDKG